MSTPRVVLCLLLLGITFVQVRTSARIIGGLQAKPNQFPFLAHLTVTNVGPPATERNCTGSLISRQWVLTLAKCLHGASSYVTVRLGGIDRDNPQVTIVSKRYFVDPEYNRDGRLAFIDLQQQVELSESINFVKLTEEMPYNYFRGYHGNFTGWGNSSNIQRYMGRFIRDYDDCKKEFPRYEFYSLCTRNEATNTHCAGDEGGPITTLDRNGEIYQIGVLTLIYDDYRECNGLTHAVFTRPDRFWGVITSMTGVVAGGKIDCSASCYP